MARPRLREDIAIRLDRESADSWRWTIVHFGAGICARDSAPTFEAAVTAISRVLAAAEER